MPTLRQWRDALGLSRPQVVDRIAALSQSVPGLDQATLAKWEKGETAVRVEDLKLLAQVYGVPVDRLFYPPGDDRTPEAMKRAFDVIVSKDPEAVQKWLAMGEVIEEAKKGG